MYKLIPCIISISLLMLIFANPYPKPTREKAQRKARHKGPSRRPKSKKGSKKTEKKQKPRLMLGLRKKCMGK